MSENGYTLADALAALFMIGLALAGLSEGMFVVGRQQRAATEDARAAALMRGADQGLARAVALYAPQGSPTDFVGDPVRAEFSCSGTQSCRLQVVDEGGKSVLVLTLPEGGTERTSLPGAGAHFAYQHGAGTSASWPVEGARLRALMLRSQDGGLIAHRRMRIEQSAECAFDPVVRACRAPAP